MPYSPDTPPEFIRKLPKGAQDIWISAFNSAYRAYDGSEAEKEEIAVRVAWAAVKKEYRQDESGKWVTKQTASKAADLLASARKRTFEVGDRIVIELNRGLDGYSALSYIEIEPAMGVYANVGTGEDGEREAAALYFLQSMGWDVLRAEHWARQWAFENGQKLKRIGIEVRGQHFAPFHQPLLKKSVADPALAQKRIAFAEVLVPYEVDTQGDIMTPEEIEAACYKFMQNPRIGIMHAKWGNIGIPVENFIAREGDRDFKAGSWVMGIQFTPPAWQHVLNDELTGLSIGGDWKEEPIEAELIEHAV